MNFTNDFRKTSQSGIFGAALYDLGGKIYLSTSRGVTIQSGLPQGIRFQLVGQMLEIYLLETYSSLLRFELLVQLLNKILSQ